MGLLGRNGTGKTTLINIIAGLRVRMEARHPATLADIFHMPEEVSFSRSVSGERYRPGHPRRFIRALTTAPTPATTENLKSTNAPLYKNYPWEGEKILSLFRLGNGGKTAAPGRANQRLGTFRKMDIYANISPKQLPNEKA